MITDVLNEIITTKSAKETGSGINQMRFENDLVTTFFDKIEKLNEEFTYSFVNDLKNHVSYINSLFRKRLFCSVCTKEPMNLPFSTLIC